MSADTCLFNRVNKIRSKMGKNLVFWVLTFLMRFPLEIKVKLEGVYISSITNVRIFHIMYVFLARQDLHAGISKFCWIFDRYASNAMF